MGPAQRITAESSYEATQHPGLVPAGPLQPRQTSALAAGGCGRTVRSLRSLALLYCVLLLWYCTMLPVYCILLLLYCSLLLSYVGPPRRGFLAATGRAGSGACLGCQRQRRHSRLLRRSGLLTPQGPHLCEGGAPHARRPGRGRRRAGCGPHAEASPMCLCPEPLQVTRWPVQSTDGSVRPFVRISGIRCVGASAPSRIGHGAAAGGPRHDRRLLKRASSMSSSYIIT